MFQSECEHAVELLHLGVDMTDIIDGFDLLKQNFEAESLRRIDAKIQTSPLSDDVKFNANPPETDGPRQISNHPKRNNSLSIGRIPLSNTFESSRIGDKTNGSPPRDVSVGDEQVRDDEEEGFGLRPSYFKKNRRV
jgi:hypothetical protein